MNIKDLVVGQIYRCELSGKPVLIAEKKELQKKPGELFHTAMGVYFNHITGRYDETSIGTGQLSKSTSDVVQWSLSKDELTDAMNKEIDRRQDK